MSKSTDRSFLDAKLLETRAGIREHAAAARRGLGALTDVPTCVRAYPLASVAATCAGAALLTAGLTPRKRRAPEVREAVDHALRVHGIHGIHGIHGVDGVDP